MVNVKEMIAGMLKPPTPPPPRETSPGWLPDFDTVKNFVKSINSHVYVGYLTRLPNIKCPRKSATLLETMRFTQGIARSPKKVNRSRSRSLGQKVNVVHFSFNTKKVNAFAFTFIFRSFASDIYQGGKSRQELLLI